MEQLYPFPAVEISKILTEHQFVFDIRWAQEEPENQGSWHFIQRNLTPLLGVNQTLLYCGRAAGSSTATGWHSQHIAEQNQLIEAAFLDSKD